MVLQYRRTRNFTIFTINGCVKESPPVDEDLTNHPLISWKCYETGYKSVLFINRNLHVRAFG